MDLAIVLFVQNHIRAEWMDGFWKFLSFLGDKGLVWIAIGLVCICFPKTRKAGIWALLVMLGCWLFNDYVLKGLAARERPFVASNLVVPLVMADGYSFPSGHTCSSFASAFVYWKMLPKPYGAAALLLAALIAFSRIYVGVHYPLDVFGGILVAFLGSSLMMEVRKRKERFA